MNTRWSAGADCNWRDRLTATSDPVSEVTVYANCRIDNRDRLNIHGVAGFSDTSPDVGIGLTVARSF